MSAASRKRSLLAAAYAVVEKRGGNALTLEAVAEEAGMSKGGMLYHFPSKRALILSMIDEKITATDRAIKAAMEKESDLSIEASLKGCFARAYINVSFESFNQDDSQMGGLLAAIANDPDMLQAYRDKSREWQKRILSDGIDRACAETIRLATDGFYYSILIGTAIPSGTELEGWKEYLLSLTRSE